MSKKVSIVMCTYNGACYLRQQLDSLLAQSYPVAEVIVQDDGSTDETMAVLEGYAERYAQIKVYKNEGTHGINGNFFSALQRASGDYIAISDQDDIWEKDKIALQMEAIGDNLLCGGFSKPFSSDGFPVKWDDRLPCLHLLRLTYLSEIPGHVQLFRRELLKLLPAVGEFACLYDWQLQTIAAAAGQIAFVPQVLVNFRRHAGAATATRPVNTQGKDALRTFVFLIRHYGQLHRCLQERFTNVLRFLNRLPFDTEPVQLTRTMARLQCGNGGWCFIRLTLFCLQHHDKLFHAREPKRWKSILRAAYFPLYCLNYYRAVVR